MITHALILPLNLKKYSSKQKQSEHHIYLRIDSLCMVQIAQYHALPIYRSLLAN